MNRPSLFSADIWTKWERGILRILSEALSQLSGYVEKDYTENDMTIELYKIILKVKYDNRQIAFGSIIPQSQNPPLNALGERENQTSLRKRPDLVWILSDEYASVPEKSQRFFTIECKCLSTDTEDRFYVEKGISRFVLNEWGYGRNEKSAAMIGYVKKGTAGRHLNQINVHNRENAYPLLAAYSDERQGVYRYAQEFKTREFEPVQFVIHHLWSDISK